MKKYIKLIFINLNVLFLFVVFLSFISIAGYKIYKGTVSSRHAEKRTSDLIASQMFKEYSWSRQFFEEQDQIVFEYAPYTLFREHTMASETINIKNGVRQSLNHSDDPDVVFLGGSTMFGQGSDDSNTIPSLVSKNLGNTVTVKNLGNTGHNAFQGLIKLELELMLNGRPDIVVSYDGVNEIVNLMKSARSFPNDIFSERLSQFFRNNESNNDRLNFIDYFNDMVQPIVEFLAIAKNKIKKKSPSSYFLSDEHSMKRAAKILVESWSKMKVLCDNASIEFICILQPTAAVGDPSIYHLQIDVLENVYQPLYTEVRSLLDSSPEYSALKQDFHDLSHVLDGEIPYYYDYCHINPQGNEMVSIAISNIIKTLR